MTTATQGATRRANPILAATVAALSLFLGPRPDRAADGAAVRRRRASRRPPSASTPRRSSPSTTRCARYLRTEIAVSGVELRAAPWRSSTDSIAAAS